jgi:putative intracellular protease/amidase
MMARKILIIVGDGGESYETLYANHRFMEDGFVPVVAAPSKRALNLVIHDFEPGWDTYVEKPGYKWSSDITFDEVNVADYEGVVVIGGRSPEYLRNDERVLNILREFDKAGKGVFPICHGVQIAAAAGLAKGGDRRRRQIRGSRSRARWQPDQRPHLAGSSRLLPRSDGLAARACPQAGREAFDGRSGGLKANLTGNRK